METNNNDNAKHVFNVTIRDRDHFYKVVNWLNEHVGKGSDKWTVEGRVLKHLKAGKPIEKKVFVFVESFDPTTALYLALI